MITFISDVKPLEAVLYHLSNVSLVSVIAETKFETSKTFATTFISVV